MRYKQPESVSVLRVSPPRGFPTRSLLPEAGLEPARGWASGDFESGQGGEMGSHGRARSNDGMLIAGPGPRPIWTELSRLPPQNRHSPRVSWTSWMDTRFHRRCCFGIINEGRPVFLEAS